MGHMSQPTKAAGSWAAVTSQLAGESPAPWRRLAVVAVDIANVVVARCWLLLATDCCGRHCVFEAFDTITAAVTIPMLMIVNTVAIALTSAVALAIDAHYYQYWCWCRRRLLVLPRE